MSSRSASQPPFALLEVMVAVAIVHVVLWTVAGLGVILWYNRPPDDDLPVETRDDNRDGMR